MDFESGEVGVLDDALKMVDSELLPGLSDEDRSRLAVEVFKSWAILSASARIARAIEGLTLSLDAAGFSRNSL